MNSRVFRKNILVSCIFFSCFGMSNTQAENNETAVYTTPVKGKTSLLMMLDSSNGMDELGNGARPERSILSDYPSNSCTTGGDVIREVSNRQLNSWYNTSSFLYGMPYCLINKTSGFSKNNMAYSRMDRMKIAMVELLGDRSVSADILMGLGQFSTQTSSRYYGAATSNTFDYISYFNLKQALDTPLNPLSGSFRREGNDVSAKIVTPATTLTNNQRNIIQSIVAGLGSGGKAPLASALAESGAYMLGTTTLDRSGIAPKVSNTTESSVRPFSFAQTASSVCFVTSANTYNYYVRSWSNRSCSANSFDYSYSGFNDSATTSKKSNSLTPGQQQYVTPIANDDQQCNANGIFLVTNSVPTETPKSVAQTLMRNALNDQNFTCPTDDSKIKAIGSGATDYGWTCMAEFAKRLNQKKIKVAVAGYGNSFIPYLTDGMYDTQSQPDGKQRIVYKCDALEVKNYTYNNQSFSVSSRNIQDIKNACHLGNFLNGYGEGGFYPVISSTSLSDAVKGFISFLDTTIPPMGVATPTIPYDTLNTTQQLSSVYYAQFQPDTRAGQNIGIWVGNIKKYGITGGLYLDKNQKTVFDATGQLQNTQDYWNVNGNDNADALTGGALSKLPIKASPVDRTIYVPNAENTLVALSAKTLQQEINSTNAQRDTKKYLLNLLGYGIAIDGGVVTDAQLNQAAPLRQMGATLNSNPVFFTTQAKMSNGAYSNRKDFILFGTVQGLIQVVDADTGQEAFSFLPQEMINQQKNGFIAKSLQTGSTYPDLYQGMDAPWSVYASYSSDGSQGVRAKTLAAYGGMRRGGKNYYGLDLSDNQNGIKPKMLFNINPSGECSNQNPIGCMGQSWSKPTIGWIKWKGRSQRVMIVGGGYDTQFDDPNFSTSSSTQGNGIYIFAAANSEDKSTMAGDLLWWTSSSATNVTTGTVSPYAQQTNDLKYSVVSEIKAIDRDSDGFIDNLYFGDLGGQIFRVDINNKASSANKSIDVPRVVRMADFSELNKIAPKFYNAPTFTVHAKSLFAGSTTNANFYGVLSIGSGDVSSPSLFARNGIADKQYTIFDKDVGRLDLYDLSANVSTTTLNLANLVPLSNVTSNTDTIDRVKSASGWYDQITGNIIVNNNIETYQTRYKILSASTALRNTLFTSYYDGKDNGSSSVCSAGIKGRTYLKTYCLPFGKGCDSGDGRGYSEGSAIGAGIQPLVVSGYQSSDGSNKIGPITPTNRRQQNLAEYSMQLKFMSKSWYEE